MYLPTIFCQDNQDELIALMQAYPLGTLISLDTDGQIAVDLLPFVVTKDNDKVILTAHIARANPLATYIDNQAVTVLFYGEHGYISPNHYPSKHIHHRHVPTYNYQVVQVRGQVSVFEDTKSLMAQIGTLTNRQEKDEPKPWKIKDAPHDYIADELKHIIGIKIDISQMIGKFKLSQNRDPEDLQGIVDGLADRHPKLSQAIARAY